MHKILGMINHLAILKLIVEKIYLLLTHIVDDDLTDSYDFDVTLIIFVLVTLSWCCFISRKMCKNVVSARRDNERN